MDNSDRLSSKGLLQINEKWEKAVRKMEVVAKRTQNIIPYTTDQNGRYLDIFEKLPAMWTNGFWPGMLWLLYKETGKEIFKDTAVKAEEMLDQALFLKEGIVENLDHDVGFLWHLSAVADYKITGNPESYKRGIIAANYLMARFNHKAEFITAWNLREREGWSIIDTMMNLPLLYWAYEVTGGSRYKEVAVLHANKSMENLIRPDGSSAHIAVYNVETGELTEHLAGQGARGDSSWTRGQGWAIYGFALSYRYTKEEAYLNTAKRVAHYYISSLSDFNNIPPSDFRCDPDKKLLDTTSAVIAVNGLLEISKWVDGREREFFVNRAQAILEKMLDSFCDFSEDTDAILQKSSERYTDEKEMTILYGDFFLIEALLKFKNSNFTIW